MQLRAVVHNLGIQRLVLGSRVALICDGMIGCTVASLCGALDNAHPFCRFAQHGQLA